MRYWKLFGCWLLCYTHVSIAFIYDFMVLEKPDTGQRVIGLCDFHDKNDPENQAHMAYVWDLLGHCKKQETLCMVEDLSSPNSAGRGACGQFTVNSRGGILGGLARECQEKGFNVENIEFRYCRVASLGPVLHNVQQHPQALPGTATIKVGALLDEVTQEVAGVKQVAACQQLKRFYNTMYRALAYSITRLHLGSCANDMSVARYLQTYSNPTNRLAMIKQLLTFDSALLDLKMATRVMAAQDKSVIVVLAGGAHISKSFQLLTKLGYRSVEAGEPLFARERNMERCLGAQIVSNSFCVRPKALTVSRLNELFAYVKQNKLPRKGSSS